MLSNDQSIAVPLLGFNMGLEAGQVVVVNLILIAGYLLLNKFSLASKWWTWSSSTIAFRMESYIAFYPWPA
ncbi:MAG: hypothetical protein ABIN92_09635 [Ferruginibacter sp.]